MYILLKMEDTTDITSENKSMNDSSSLDILR